VSARPHAAPVRVVTLPARGVEEARVQIREASGDGADWSEVRVDRWPATERERIAELFPSPCPLLATYRSRAEGGEGEDERDRRAPVIAALLAHPFHAIDLELYRDLPFADPVALAARGRPATLRLVSAHLPKGTTSAAVRAALSAAGESGHIAKVVVPSTVGDAVEGISAVLPEPGSASYVLHTTGPSGPLFRAWADRLGMRLVFAAPADVRGHARIESAQLPVDALAWGMGGDRPAPLFALLGRPVGHSRSPSLHGSWMRALDCRGLYVALEVGDAGELARVLPPLVEGGFRGFNVTHPLKGPAFEVADAVSPVAERVRAANLLTLTEEGVRGENTDVPAFEERLRALAALPGLAPADRVTILGAGGAARAALLAAELLELPAEVLARDARAAEEAARDFGAEVIRDEPVRPASLLVNATPAGRSEAPTLELPFRPLVDRSTRILDAVYAPHHPFLRELAHGRGAHYEDGTRLLVGQAALSFEVWWGRPVPPELVARAIGGFA
jgi:shikimate dehydrogenase